MAQAVLPDSQVFVLEGYTMTNAPMSEREAELVGAVQDFRAKANLKLLSGGEMTIDWNFDRMMKAIRAYDPKPEPVPVIPAWEEFVKGKEQIWLIGPDDKTPCGVRLRENGITTVWREDYDLLRTLTSRAPPQ